MTTPYSKMQITFSSQLELFVDSPFALRLPVVEALRIFKETYWNALPSAKTTKKHFVRLNQYFANHYLDTVSKRDIEEMRVELTRSGLSIPSINKHHVIMSRLYTKMAEYKEAGVVQGIDFSRLILPTGSANPAAQVPRPNEAGFARKTTISPTQLAFLKEHGDEEFREDLNMLVWTRLRPGDLKRLTIENINWNSYQLQGIQHKTITRKRPEGVPYTVPLTFEIERILRRRIQVRPEGAQLFPMTNMQKKWDAARKGVGLFKLVQLRDLRRSGAASLLWSGIDIKTVSEGLGHTTTRVTATSYTPTGDKQLKDATKKLVEIYKP